MPRRTTTEPQNKTRLAFNPATISVSLKLRRLREARGLKLRAVARTMAVSASQLSAWELGRRLPDPSTTAFILAVLRVDYSTAQRIITQARQSTVPDLADTDHRDHAALGWHYEHLADRTTIWAPALIPDLLRTPEHDLSLFTHPVADTDLDDAYAAALPQRRDDLADLTRRYTFLIGDTALRACPPLLHHDQITYLRAMAQQRNITIVIVAAQVCPPGLVAPFTLFEKDRITIAAALRHHHASTYLTDPSALNRFRRTATRLRKLGTTTITDLDDQPHDHVPQLEEHRRALSTSATADDAGHDAVTAPQALPHPSPPPSLPSTVPVIEPRRQLLNEPAPSPARHGGDSAAPEPDEPHRAHSVTHDPAASVLIPGVLVLGEQVARLRAARGLARDHLAAAIEVPASRLARLEHGHTVLSSLVDIAAMADVLGAPRAELATAALHDYEL
ncbi:Scr1 family TA system antitoxin-like transcriptional regulator [Amycolatopsis sp. NPDC051371]|uniref:Scr1 family TA system antitoxin-like transcriptional regulator n=1 Tax=Amycolatopsis sp. NPDC051371 TaxID=3155800 RepID=UPI00342C0892